jgi:hypothetical protein
MVKKSKSEKKAKVRQFHQSTQTEKQAKKRQAFTDRKDSHPVWQLELFDFNGEWNWQRIENTKAFQEILKKLANFEARTWGQIEGDQEEGSHFIKVCDLSSKAQKRLEYLKLDEVEELFSLRLSGKERLFGIVDRFIFKILWYDAEHQVCPSQKKHT